MKKQDRYYYPAVFSYENGQEISVFFPDLDVATSGTDDRDALLSARECLGITLLGIETDGDPIPEPSHLSDIHTDNNEYAILVDVFMPAVRLASANRAVNRTVTLPAWLNAKALENGINFSQVLQEALKKQLGLY